MNLADLIRANNPRDNPPPKPRAKPVNKFAIDADAEEKVVRWIAALTGDSKGDRESLANFLHDGVVLCNAINRLVPGAVKKIGRKGEPAALENINAFRKAVKDYGVPETKVFLPDDLFKRQNMNEVVKTLVALANQAEKHPEYDGPPFK